MNRRPYKEGSIYQDGDKWVAAISFTDRLTGKRIRRRKHSRTKTEAVKNLKKMQETYGQNGRLPDDQRTVNQAVDDYATHRRSNPNLSEGTHEKDDWMRSIINDGLGKCKTIELTLPDCEIFLRRAVDGIAKSDGTKRKKIKPPQLKRLRRQLINVLDNEMRLGLLDRNVAYASQVPASSSKADKPKRAMALDDFETLLENAEGDIELLIELVGRYGMRPQEVRAIRWSSIDLETSVLTVTEEMDKQNNYSEVKTKRSGRGLQLEADTIQRIEDHKPIQEAQRQRQLLGESWSAVLSISATEFGKPHNRYQFNTKCKQLCTRLGIPSISPYDLRHTAVSYQAERGHNAWEIADWTGTSEKMISDVYRHQLNKVSKLRRI